MTNKEDKEAREKATLPKNPYTTEYKYQCQMDVGMPQGLIVNDDAYVAYEEAQQDMLKAGYRKPLDRPELREERMIGQTQTEKLGMKLIGNVQDIYWLGREKCRLSDDQINLEIARILQDCKEAGLKFVGSELTLPPIKNPNAQIKEIEL